MTDLIRGMFFYIRSIKFVGHIVLVTSFFFVSKFLSTTYDSSLNHELLQVKYGSSRVKDGAGLGQYL